MKRTPGTSVPLWPLQQDERLRHPTTAGLPAQFARVLLVRGAIVWLGARFMVVALFTAIRGMADEETAALFTETNALILAAWTLALSAMLIHVDLHRRHEVSLLNNLGVTISYAVGMGLAPAIGAELLLLVL